MPQDYLDTLTFSHELYDQIPRAMAFQASTKTVAEDWQVKLRAKLIELLGGFPSEKCDLPGTDNIGNNFDCHIIRRWAKPTGCQDEICFPGNRIL